MIAASSTSTFGLAVWTFLLAIAVWIAGVARDWQRNRKIAFSTSPLMEALKNSKDAAVFEIGTIAVFALAMWGLFVVRTVYYDHTGLRYQVQLLSRANSGMVDPASRDAQITDLQNQLEMRKQMLVMGDPSFDNMRKILTTFNEYRYASKGQKCYVYITSPSPTPMISIVSEFSNSVSGCFTLSSWGSENTDAEEEVKRGMIPGKVLVHGSRDDAAANQVEAELSNILPVERSYKTLSTSFPHYQNQAPGDMVLWLQFGPDVHWNSERLGGTQ